jgi:hypothetical protein
LQHIAIIIRWILIHFKIIIITSSSLPKREVSNGLYGEKDGILLVLPLILVQVAKTICEGITRIDRESKSKEDRTFKEAKLYDYIRSQELDRLIAELYQTHTKMFKLQNKEERYHQTLWKETKNNKKEKETK